MVKKTAVQTTPAPAQLAEQLRVITAAGPGLRKAGYTRIELGELRLEIEPALPEAPPRRRDAELGSDFLDPKKYRRDGDRSRDRDRDEMDDDQDGGGR